MQDKGYWNSRGSTSDELYLLVLLMSRRNNNVWRLSGIMLVAMPCVLMALMLTVSNQESKKKEIEKFLFKSLKHRRYKRENTRGTLKFIIFL